MTASESATDAGIFPGSRPALAEISIGSVCLAAVWLLCLVVGSLGLVLPYSHPRPPIAAAAPVQAEILNVELTSKPLAPPDAPPPQSPSEPPPLLQPLNPPAATPLMAVAEPSPAIAFALPIEGPVRVVEAKKAAYVQTQAPTNAVAPPVVQALTFGQGEGKQPAPEYPRQAIRQGQEGSVTVRLAISETGQVTEAQAVAPSPWPLLNDAALRAVRNRWRFRPGTIRVYDVQIRFELDK